MCKLVGRRKAQGPRGTEVHDRYVNGDLLLQNAFNLHLCLRSFLTQVISTCSFASHQKMADLRFDNQTVVVTGAGGGQVSLPLCSSENFRLLTIAV